MVPSRLSAPGQVCSKKNRVRKLFFCLVMGLLIFVSAPPNHGSTEKNLSKSQADSLGSSQSEEVRVAGSAILTPQQSRTGIILGVGLIGFVVMNAKRRNRN